MTCFKSYLAPGIFKKKKKDCKLSKTVSHDPLSTAGAQVGTHAKACISCQRESRDQGEVRSRRRVKKDGYVGSTPVLGLGFTLTLDWAAALVCLDQQEE